MAGSLRAIAVVSLVGIGAGCGGSTATSNKPAVVRSQSTAFPQSSNSPQAPAARPVGKTVWFQGFKLTIDSASYTPPTQGTQQGLLTLNTTFENLGNDPAEFRGQSSVNSHGQDFPSNNSGTSPNVPGGGKGKGTILYEVDNTFSLDNAVVTFGKPDETKAKVPLGAGGTVVSLAPLAVTGLTAVSVGQVKIDFKSGEAKADKTAEHGQAANGHWYVYLTGTLSFSGGSAGINFGPENLSLKLPDGTSVVGEAADSKSCCFALYPGQTPEFTFRFLVGDPPSGTFTGTAKSKVDVNDVTAPFTFQVSASPAASASSTPSTAASPASSASPTP